MASCPDAYYASEFTSECLECSSEANPDCLACSGKNFCTLCHYDESNLQNDMYLYNGDCISSCPPSTYEIEYEPESGQTAFKCIDCSTISYNCQQCQFNTVTEYGECLACVYPLKPSADGYACDQCEDGYYYDSLR